MRPWRQLAGRRQARTGVARWNRHLGLHACLGRKNLEGCAVELKKTDGRRLPLEDQTIDLALTVTVLQHNVDPAGLRRVIAELCRVSAGRIVIMEDTGDMISAPKGSSWIMRPVGVYEAEFERHGFHLRVRLT